MIALKNDVEGIERQLSDLGPQQDIKQEDHWETLFQIISDFSKEYEKLIYNGHAILDNDEEAPCKKIFDILHIDFERELRIDHTQNLNPDRVKRWINNATVSFCLQLIVDSNLGFDSKNPPLFCAVYWSLWDRNPTLL